jgi:hypothetical protein
MSEKTLTENDIYPSPVKERDFEKPDLKTLRKEVETEATEAINWYLQHKKAKAKGSKYLRVFSIIFIFIGGISPILQGLEWLNLQDCQYGYIALALAAVCIALDKFFGFSSSWMRYMMTEIKLQKALANFQTDWMLIWTEVKDNTPTAEQHRQLLQRIKEFRLNILTEIEHETKMWTHEFQSNLSQLERITETQKKVS